MGYNEFRKIRNKIASDLDPKDRRKVQDIIKRIVVTANIGNPLSDDERFDDAHDIKEYYECQERHGRPVRWVYQTPRQQGRALEKAVKHAKQHIS